MTELALSTRQDRTLTIVAYATLLAVAATGVAAAPSPTARWGVAGVCLLFGLALARMPSPPAPALHIHLYLLLQTVLVAAAMALHPDWTIFALLNFLLSAQAMVLLPAAQGVLWIVLFLLVVTGFGLARWGWPEALLAILIYGGGFGFFGVFANALVKADEARRQSERLLADLEQAHRQLQDSALRAEELAVVEERNRMAREMHDTLGHRLTVTAVQLEAAGRLIPTEPERAMQMVGTAREQVREALAELRGTVATLRTPVAVDLQLGSALRRLVADFEAATGVPVHQAVPDELPALPEMHRLALYRAAQEGLTNIQRHAQASQAWLVLDVRDGTVRLLIGDDGRGLPAAGAGDRGFGLRGLCERAVQLGGDCHVAPRPGGGTQLSFQLTLPE
ncbi:MAG TPA: sensor histidine kinase [Anaerolineae bacterium]|nr:sensor histidine kinase [Anaerolineae bacterium]